MKHTHVSKRERTLTYRAILALTIAGLLLLAVVGGQAQDSSSDSLSDDDGHEATLSAHLYKRLTLMSHSYTTLGHARIYVMTFTSPSSLPLSRPWAGLSVRWLVRPLLLI